jgi:hypothetical protein
MDKPTSTFKELRERTKLSSNSKSKTSKEKRQDKINKLQDNPQLWKFLEQYLNEDLTGLNRSFIKFRSIYQSGRKYSGKEWIEMLSELLGEID